MTDPNFLADCFEANRSHLRSVAYRMLGSRDEADDAVQATFLRLMRAGSTDGIDNLRGWLTTIVARVCLDMLRQREVRSETPLGAEVQALPAADNPEHEQLISDSVGVAMLVVLDTLTPAERVAFVLHDIFSISFDDIALVVGRSPVAVRQLASRGRRRLQGAPSTSSAERTRKRELIGAFLTASQRGDLSALLAILDPDVLLRADATAVQMSGRGRIPALASEIRGRDRVTDIFQGRARAAQLAWIDGEAGLVFAPDGLPKMVVEFALEAERIVEICMVADAEHVASLDLEF